MTDRLGELLSQSEAVYGIICRDPSDTDMELLAQAGYNVVWIDLEHGAIPPSRAISLCRTITHLGMVPLARIGELGRHQVQNLLDVGYKILILPSITNAQQAERFVQLGKYPPLGCRGVSSSAAANDFNLGSDPLGTLAQANRLTRLMVQFEDDIGYSNLDSILAVDGIGMVTAGLLDWAMTLGLSGDEAKSMLSPKIEKIFTKAQDAGKITAMTVGNSEQAQHYVKLGVRIIFTGVDVAMKSKVFREALNSIRSKPQ